MHASLTLLYLAATAAAATIPQTRDELPGHAIELSRRNPVTVGGVANIRGFAAQLSREQSCVLLLETGSHTSDAVAAN